MKHTILSAILITAIMIACTGCSNPFKPAEKSVNEMALEYLEEKYGEKFEYAAPAGSSYTGTRAFLAKCGSFGDNRILVEIEDFKDEEKRVIRDNYLVVKYADEMSDYLSGLVNEQFGECKVWHGNNHTSSANLPANASFDEFLKDPSNQLFGWIVVKKSDYNDRSQLAEILETITAECAAEDISISVVVLDDLKYADCNSEKARDYSIRGDCFAKGEILRGEGSTSIDYYGE